MAMTSGAGEGVVDCGGMSGAGWEGGCGEMGGGE